MAESGGAPPRTWWSPPWLREAIAKLRAKTDPHGGVPWLEPELGAVFAALDAAPTETGSGEA